MANYSDWTQALKKVESVSDFDERQAKIERISADPKPQYSPPPVRSYKTTELHYIMCVDEENANLSMPEADLQYNTPHKVGGVMVTDRFETPLGWIKSPPKGTSVDTVKDTYPELYAALVEKKVTNF